MPALGPPRQHRPRRCLRRDGASLGLVKRNQINLQLDLVPFNQLQRRMRYGTHCVLAAPARRGCRWVGWLRPAPRGLGVRKFVGPAVGAAIGLGLTMAVPAALYVLGFTKAGIAAGSVAARMMSLAAVANGGRVAAGSLVAIAQSLGAAGVPTAVWAALSAIGAAIGTVLL
ncbi:PREDICTED: interferon alpha-inducible protein 27-like protein 2A [Nipponia nippon]|uniref:interferon alpha-inducible protein 27-like protein 2A n=1 Tax=Nipponia nippon TaxID=128390 RepID=UPI000510B60E|nr:PREDICTED: interferon alpha-inducible protein 27-like protein 2A [Nipponia nippon]